MGHVELIVEIANNRYGNLPDEERILSTSTYDQMSPAASRRTCSLWDDQPRVGFTMVSSSELEFNHVAWVANVKGTLPHDTSAAS